jgi:hypothetical protein
VVLLSTTDDNRTQLRATSRRRRQWRRIKRQDERVNEEWRNNY